MPIIEVNHLAKSYGDRRAVRDVSFAVESGEIFGILGPNGAGKTTTVECVAGLRKRDGGAISVLGVDPASDRAAIREQVGVQLQECELPERIRVDEALELYASFYQHPADWRELREVLGLGAHGSQRYGKLSGGQKQRLSIALALIGDPTIAILDELTTGLDPAARRETWALIERVRDRGVTVILVTHFMAEAEHLCDRIAIIDNGQVTAIDTPAGLVARAGAQQRVRFRPSAPIDLADLQGLDEVSSVEQAGPTVIVTGTGDVLAAVTSLLARHQVIARELRVEQASLDDAFLVMTGHQLDTEGSPA